MLSLGGRSCCVPATKGCSRINHSASPSRLARCFRQGSQIQVKADQGRQQSTQQVESPESDAEAQRIAELEGRKRRRKGKGRPGGQYSSESVQTSAAQKSGFADWPEGQLLPSGWDQMNPVQKAGELWSGRRGALFWANKAAWASLFIVGGAWVLFRIVGPLTGLYTLKNDLLSPPNL